MKFKVSVIVPVYNSEKFLKKCVESLLKQSYKNLEIILVDDGSKDNSPIYIRKYMEKFPLKIKGIFLENGGVSRARNRGIQDAEGNLIAFCDADDYMGETYIESLVNPFIQNGFEKISMAIGNITFIKDNIQKVEHVSNELNSISVDTALNSIVKPNIGGYVWNKMFRRDLIEKVNLTFDEKINMTEDFLFVSDYLYLNKGYNVSIVEDAGYYYVHRQDSAINSGREFTSVDAELKILRYSKKYPHLHRYLIKDYVNKLVQKEFFYESKPTSKKFKAIFLEIENRQALNLVSRKHKIMLWIGIVFPITIPIIRKLIK